MRVNIPSVSLCVPALFPWSSAMQTATQAVKRSCSFTKMKNYKRKKYLSTMCMENSDKPTVCLDLLSIKYQLRSLQLLLPIPGPLLEMADVFFLFSWFIPKHCISYCFFSFVRFCSSGLNWWSTGHPDGIEYCWNTLFVWWKLNFWILSLCDIKGPCSDFGISPQMSVQSVKNQSQIYCPNLEIISRYH